MTLERQERPRSATTAGKIWILCAVASILVVGELILAAAVHRDAKTLRNEIGDADSGRAVWALFVATNRNQPERFDTDRIGELLSSPNSLVREWIFTTNFSRMLPRRQQGEFVGALVEPASAARAHFLLEHGIHQTPWISLAEVEAHFETIDD